VISDRDHPFSLHDHPWQDAEQRVAKRLTLAIPRRGVLPDQWRWPITVKRAALPPRRAHRPQPASGPCGRGCGL